MKNLVYSKPVKNMLRLFILLFFTFVVCTEFTQAQTEPNVLWAKQFGGTNEISIRGMTTDVYQNIYLTGRFRGTADFEGISLTTTGSAFSPFVVKTDASGEVLWAKQFSTQTNNSYGEDITVDNIGNVYSIGSFAGTASFDAITLTTSTSTQVTFVVKQSTLGEVLWVVKFDDTTQENLVSGRSITTDTQGNIYTVGYFRGQTAVFGEVNLFGNSQGKDTGFVAKQDTSGNVLWAKSFVGTGHVEVGKIVLDLLGNIYITGEFWDTVSFGDTTLSCFNVYNVFVAKLDNSGQTIWAKNFGEGSPEANHYSRGSSIALDTGNNIYVTGNFKGVLMADTNPVNSYEGYSSPFVFKTNNSGELLWVKGFEATGISNTGSEVTTDNLNNVYVVGTFGGTILLNNNTSFTASGVYDGYVLKMDNLGNIEWAGKFGGIGNDSASDIVVNTEGDLYVTGIFRYVVQFGTYTLATEGASNIFLLKLSEEGLSINNTEPQKWSTYPNPVKDFLTIEFTDNTEKTSIEIFNILGQKIKTFENVSNAENLDLSDLTPGIYLLKINHNGAIQTIKIKKQ